MLLEKLNLTLCCLLICLLVAWYQLAADPLPDGVLADDDEHASWVKRLRGRVVLV